MSGTPQDVLAWAERDGVDLSMLRERLCLTPTERIQRHQAVLTLVEALQQAKKQGRNASDRATTQKPE
jgi:hypothetical protein